MKRIISLILTLAAALSLLVLPAGAAPTPEEALGEVNIYNGGYRMAYLAVNGEVQSQNYAYFLYRNSAGEVQEIPAYCVTPNQRGVHKVVAEGESVRYLAEEAASDPKIVGMVANMYPHRSLAELGLDNKYQAFYAGKIALWCYLIPDWDIRGVTVAPGLTGTEREIGEKILNAVVQIYNEGTQWTQVAEPRLTTSPDRETAYPVTIGGQTYYQQVFTVESPTWVDGRAVNVSFQAGSDVPEGTRIVDEENRDITQVEMSSTGTRYSYAGKFKVLYPAEAVTGKTGSIQLTLSADVYQYVVFYALCQEKDKYGNLQNYLCDTDPKTSLLRSAVSNYSDSPDGEPEGTALRITKYEAGTTVTLSGASFEVVGPEGDTIGIYATPESGSITIPLTEVGNYTIYERQPPAYHLLDEEPVKQVTVRYGEVAEVSFENEPYGDLRIEKIDGSSGASLSGAKVQIRHIESGAVYADTTGTGGSCTFTQLRPGAYEILELAAPEGWQRDPRTYTTTVVAGECVTYILKNDALPGLKIIKYDRESHEVMSGVTFRIWRDGTLLGDFETDELGEILLTDCQPGTYRVQEVDTGDSGHLLDSAPQEIELEAGDGIKELVFFNDKKPGIWLVKVDSSDLSKPIANAKFRFEAVDGSFGPVEYTTLEDGTIDLSELPTGAYVVTELECPGYVIDDAQRIIQLEAGQTAEFVFTNSKLPSLTLTKLSSDGSPLAGTSYSLTRIEDGSRYMDQTTSTAGTITWEGLEPGVYSLKETDTVSDHILDTKEYHVELFPGKDSTIVLENSKRPNLTVVKRDADSGAPVADAVFLVEAADGHSVDELKTGADGTATLENLLPGVYEVTEKSVPAPYLLDAEPQLVTLYPDRDRTVYFENHRAPVIEIIKENEITHDPIENVPFQIWYASNNTSTGEYNDLGVYYTDEEGRIVLSDPELSLRDGWFRIEELEPPKGFSLTESSKQEAFIAAGEGHTFRIYNRPNSAIVVWKYDSVHPEQAIEGAVFQVRYLSGNTSGTGGTVIGTYRTSPNGSFTVTDCKPGTYIIEELYSDGSHVIDTPPQTVYLSGEEQEVIQVHFGNSPMGSLLIKKVSSTDNAPISGVQFFVTESDGTVIGHSNGYFTTDSTGTILIEGIEPGTALVVKETRAKEGFLLDDTPQTAQVKAGQTVTLEFRNQPQGNLIIHKLSSADKSPLEGVQFKITYADGSYLPDKNGQLSSNGLYWTNSEGQIVLSNVTGTLVITEVQSIPGYTIDPNTQSQTVVVRADDTQELWFYNEPVGGVEIIKVNADNTRERIPNTTFEIRRMDDALVETVTTDKNGRVSVPLEDGSYYAVEAEAAEGFRLDDTPHYFEVESGKTTTLRVENTPVSAILIHKTDSTTGEGICGVSFLLYDDANTPIGQYTSDNEGYVLIEGLEAGRYYLRELENEGYVPDTQKKTVYVESGETTEVAWENTPITGQIQVTKTSADYNSVNGWPAGTPIPGTEFEIYNARTGSLVDTIRTDKNGVASSRPLPLGRYQIIESKAADFYTLDKTPIGVEIEFAGQIVKAAMTNRSLYTSVSIQKTGYVEVMPGQQIRYDFSGIANNSTTSLTSFYWRDTLPSQAIRLDKLVTGTYNVPGNYKVVYKTNLNPNYRTMYDNLSTRQNYVLDASKTALGLASNEYVTEFMVSFGVVPANFRQVEAPQVYATVYAWLTGGSQFVNQADAGGVYDGQWIMATSRWVTRVYKPSEPLPRTGY